MIFSADTSEKQKNLLFTAKLYIIVSSSSERLMFSVAVNIIFCLRYSKISIFWQNIFEAYLKIRDIP